MFKVVVLGVFVFNMISVYSGICLKLGFVC